MFVRAHRAALALTALVLIATGCGSNGSSRPVSLPSLDATSSASASPTPTTVDDKSAVELVVRRYYALLNAKTSEQQAQQLEAITSADCPCHRPVAAIRDALRRNRHFFGSNRIVHLLPTIDGARVADVIVEYDYTREGVADAGGHIVTASRGRRGVKERVVVQWRNSKWVIIDISQIAAGAPL